MRRRVLFFVILSLLTVNTFAEYSDFYYDWARFFYPSMDDNAGMTLFPSLFIPLGGKNEGMGTAFTAVANDISFIESNPAGSSLLPKTELAFLHHSWIMDSNLEGVTYVTRLDDLGLAAAGKFLYVPFNEKDGWGRAGGKGYYLELIATLNASYNLFKSYYFNGLSVGANVKVAYMGVPESVYADQSYLTVMADVGVLTRFNLLKFYNADDKNFSIGATFRNVSPLPSDDPLPTLASFGLAYSPLRPLLLAVDFNLPVSFNPNIPAEKYYFAAGFTLAFSPFLSLQGGVKLKSSNPMVTLGATLDLDTVTFMVNYNLDLSSTMDPLDKFSLSAKFNLGDMGRSTKQQEIEKLYLTGIELYSNDRLEEAIATWEKVLELDPEHTPARHYLQVARDALNLKKEIQGTSLLE